MQMPSLPYYENTKEEQILSFIHEIQILLLQQSSNTAPYDYHTLREQVTKLELQEETDDLIVLIHKSDHMNLFKIHCAERAIRNANSYLNYCAIPQGTCNQLYSKIATLLFEPKTLGDLLQILLPGTIVISCDLFIDTPHARHPNLRLTEHTLDYLTEPPDLDILSNFILVDNLLLDVREISNFDFHLHQVYYKLLNTMHPNLAHALYQRNSILRTLQNDILTINNSGQTPAQVIQSFIIELKIGGTKITGNIYASLNAQVAFTEFKNYLESLPQALKDKLLTLGTMHEVRIMQAIINDLHQGNCVENAAKELQYILDNPANYLVLNTYHDFSATELKKINKKYARPHTLHIDDNNAIMQLPTNYLNKTLAKIYITTAYNYLDILLSFPSTLYASLLQNVSLPNPPLLPELITVMRSEVLNHEQQHAFNHSLIIAHKRFGGYLSLLPIAVIANNLHLLQHLLQTLPATERLAAIKKKDGFDNTTLNSALSNQELFKVILELLPKTDRLAAVQEKNEYGNTALHSASVNTNQALLKIILELLPATDRFTAVQQKNTLNETLLHAVINKPALIITILQLLPVSDRFAAIKEKDNYGNTVLHKIIIDPELKEILELLPATDRLTAIQEKNNFGYTVLQNCNKVSYRRVRNLSIQLVVLQSLPPHDRRTISKTKDMYLFKNLSPHELGTHYSQDSTNLTLCMIIEERLHALLFKKDARSIEAWNVLVSILATENKFVYNDKLNIAISLHKTGATMSSICTAHLLLQVYLQSATLSFRQELAKNLLIQYAKKTKRPEDYLALAIIADKETRTKEKNDYLRKLTHTQWSVGLFCTTKRSNSINDVILEVIQQRPTTTAFIEKYQTEIQQLNINFDIPMQEYTVITM